MKEVIEKLDKLNNIYDIKLTSIINILEDMNVADDDFDKMLDRSAKLMSLKLQTVDFKEKYEESENMKEEKEYEWFFRINSRIIR